MSNQSYSNKSYQQHGGSYRPSANKATGANKATSSRVPCCPHCSNINKFSKTSTILPTDHFLRETPTPDSKLVCPVLLATECRFCGEYGHTVSKCPAAAAENKHYAKQELDRAKLAAEAKVAKPAKKIVNRFSVLGSDSDDEVVKTTKSTYSSRTPMQATKRKREEEPQFDFPALNANATTTTTTTTQMNFAKAVVLPVKPVVLAKSIDIPAIPSVLLYKPSSIALASRPCWADSDSDDEDTESDRQRCADEYIATMEAREHAIMMRRKLEDSIAIDKFIAKMDAKESASIICHHASSVDSW